MVKIVEFWLRGFFKKSGLTLCVCYLCFYLAFLSHVRMGESECFNMAISPNTEWSHFIYLYLSCSLNLKLAG